MEQERRKLRNVGRKSITGQLKEKLIERGYVLAEEIEETGVKNVSSCANHWRRGGLNVVNYPKGSLLNGEYIEKGFYVWEDPKAPEVDAQLPLFKEAREKTGAENTSAEKKLPQTDKWKALKDRILRDKQFLCDTGNKESTSYKVLVHVDKVMEELDFEEKGGPYK